jgi:hypothetical protein
MLRLLALYSFAMPLLGGAKENISFQYLVCPPLNARSNESKFSLTRLFGDRFHRLSICHAMQIVQRARSNIQGLNCSLSVSRVNRDELCWRFLPEIETDRPTDRASSRMTYFKASHNALQRTDLSLKYPTILMGRTWTSEAKDCALK